MEQPFTNSEREYLYRIELDARGFAMIIGSGVFVYDVLNDTQNLLHEKKITAIDITVANFYRDNFRRIWFLSSLFNDAKWPDDNPAAPLKINYASRGSRRSSSYSFRSYKGGPGWYLPFVK